MKNWEIEWKKSGNWFLKNVNKRINIFNKFIFIKLYIDIWRDYISIGFNEIGCYFYLMFKLFFVLLKISFKTIKSRNNIDTSLNLQLESRGAIACNKSYLQSY
ncbi:hypothetical protein PCK1_000858 [Pneumocystis canis]|nr:hypothetical protein PCK1_000858 [Pneumocystis canis]